MSKMEQKVVTLHAADGQYHNFFYSPFSYGSLERHINAGWMVKFLIHDPLKQDAVVIFERDIIDHWERQRRDEKNNPA